MCAHGRTCCSCQYEGAGCTYVCDREAEETLYEATALGALAFAGAPLHMLEKEEEKKVCPTIVLLFIISWFDPEKRTTTMAAHH